MLSTSMVLPWIEARTAVWWRDDLCMTVVAAPNASAELWQHLIRLQCVNTGQPDSGDETRAAELLRAVVDVPGVDVQSFGPSANRQSLVARLPGTDPAAPTLLLLG